MTRHSPKGKCREQRKKREGGAGGTVGSPAPEGLTPRTKDLHVLRSNERKGRGVRGEP